MDCGLKRSEVFTSSSASLRISLSFFPAIKNSRSQNKPHKLSNLCVKIEIKIITLIHDYSSSTESRWRRLEWEKKWSSAQLYGKDENISAAKCGLGGKLKCGRIGWQLNSKFYCFTAAFKTLRLRVPIFQWNLCEPTMEIGSRYYDWISSPFWSIGAL